MWVKEYNMIRRQQHSGIIVIYLYLVMDDI